MENFLNILKEILIKLGLQLNNGANLMKEEPFTQQERQSLTQLEISLSMFALFVEILSKLGIEKNRLVFVPLNVKDYKDTAQVLITSKKCASVGKSLSSISTKKQNTALHGVVDAQTQKVYNITVEEEHEYFAEGILVANCDALRYAAIQIPWDFTRAEEERKPKETDYARQLRERREHYEGKSSGPEEEEPSWDVQEELDEWSSYLE